MPQVRQAVIVAVVVLFTTQCIVVRSVDIDRVSVVEPSVVDSPVRAHLKDGSTVLFPRGVRVTPDAVVGGGTMYDLLRTTTTPVGQVDLENVVGIETYRGGENGPATFALSMLVTAATVFGTAALGAAIFGSCPTVYSGDGEQDEAELFSTSIAPLFEARDIDRLTAQADVSGNVTLEIRNEALESHYINHLQLIEARHHANEFVLPDAGGLPVEVRDLVPVAAAVNRRGRDVWPQVARAGDREFYATELDTLAAATRDDLTDWIDVDVPVAAGASDVALVFRLRNSLLNTILLYDVMLGRSGAGALDWMGRGLAEVSTAVELGRWHQARAGLHVQVREDGGRYRTVARIPDAGPISWRDVAAVIPVSPGATSMRVRLSFVADHWRIDRISAGVPRAITPRVIPLARVTTADGVEAPEAKAGMVEADARYLETSPGQRFFARFEAGPVPADVRRTFLLGSQGYYTEWIRPAWIAGSTQHEAFVPSDDALLDALRRWATRRDEFERQFFNSRVPVR